MTQTVAVVRNTLTATLAGTTDFTKSGFGTPNAAIIILNNAHSIANPNANARFSVGFWDGTNQSAVGISALDGQATTATHRMSDDSYGAIATTNSGTALAAFTVSAITDGIRLTMSVDNTTAQFFCTVLLISGISAKLLTFTGNTTQDATQESASLGFAPKLIFFSGIGSNAADVASGSATMILSFGVAKSDGTHRLMVANATNAAADEQLSLLYSETRCFARVAAEALVVSGEVTTWGADTFTVTTRDGSFAGTTCFALALGGADFSADVGTLTTLTSGSPSTDVVATDVAPDALLLVATTQTTTGIATDSAANGFSVGLGDDTSQSNYANSYEDAAGTSNTNSASQNAEILDLDSSSGGSRTDLIDATVVLNNNDFTLNYTAADASARKGWWVAFGPATGSTGTAQLYERPDSITSTAAVAIAASAQLREAADTISSAASVAVSASGTLNEVADSVLATASVAVAATALLQEQPDTIVSLVGSISAIDITAVLNEQPDQIYGSAQALIAATASLQENGDLIAAAVSAQITINASLNEAGDWIYASVSQDRTATVLLSEEPDSISATVIHGAIRIVRRISASDRIGGGGITTTDGLF